MLEEKLCQIGLTGGEAKVYLELLKIGAQAVSVIAKRANLNRTTTYSILKSLQKKGFVSVFVNSNVKYFSANDPNCLVAFVDSKCRTYDYFRDEILMMVPKFRALNEVGLLGSKPIVSYYEGTEGVKYLMNDGLKSQGEFLSYWALHKWLESDQKSFMLGFIKERIQNKGIKLHAMAPDTEKVRSFFDMYRGKENSAEVLYVLDESCWGIFENAMNIYDDKVAIFHLDKGNEYGVLIESKEIAIMQKTIFEIAWKEFFLRMREKG